MINGILNGILNLIGILVSFITAPINIILSGLFPDVSDMLGYFADFVNGVFTPVLAYFGTLFPPAFKTVLSVWIVFVLSYYAIIYTYLGIIQIYIVLRRIKFW